MKRNWEYLSIGVCFPSIKNGANIKQIAGANGYPITRIETLSGGAFNRDRMGYANIVDLTKYQDYILESGDLLLSHINSKAYIGRTVKYEKQGDEKIIHGMNLLRLRANPEVISSSLFAYYSKSMKFKDAVARIRKDAVNQSSMAISDLKKIIVPVPPLEEQSRIVAELDLLTGIIDKQNAQLKELDNLAQAIFYDMFGDPIENPKGWDILSFMEVCSSLFAGGDVPKDRLSNQRSSEFPIPILSNGIGEKALYGFTDKARVSEECITISGRGTIGYCEIRKEPFFPVVRLIVAVPNQKMMLPILLKYIVDGLHFHGNGGAIPQLTIPMIKDARIFLPPLALQQSFAEKIQSIEKQKETIRASIADTQKLLDYTMDKYFG